MFGLFKKKYPVLTNEMLEPVDSEISTTEAKKIYKQFMKQIGFLEKDELADHASYLSDEIKENEQYLKDDIADKKSEIKDEKERLKTLKANLKKSTDDTKEDIESDIEDCLLDIDYLNKDLDKEMADLATFKKDKRAFLIEYINNEVQRSS